MDLKEKLLRGIYAYGFEKPSAIQQRAIMPCIQGLYLNLPPQQSSVKGSLYSIGQEWLFIAGFLMTFLLI